MLPDAPVPPPTRGESRPGLGVPDNRVLDRVVAGIWTRFEAHGIAPHAVSWGVAIVALPVVAGLSSRGWVAPMAWLVTIAAYQQGYLRLKGYVFPGARRTLLVDLSTFVAPVFIGLCAVLGLGPRAALDALAFVVPAGIVVLRSGCFFGGCCHGRPSRFGVRYPGSPTRVLPLPLFEAVVGVGLLATAATRSADAPPGALALPLLASYAGYRFFAEFRRARDGRFAVRRLGGLSLTQWLSLAIVGAAVGLGVGP
jgi:hypothetical protein